MGRGTVAACLLLTACIAAPPAAVDSELVGVSVTCGGPAFSADVLASEGGAEEGNDPAAAALRALLDTPEALNLLPRAGWKVAVRHDDVVLFVADAPPDSEPPLVDATFERVGGAWRATGFGQCWPQADVGPDLGLASFRVAPGFELRPDATRIDVLVTERACNSGEDARGRIVKPAVVAGAESVVVVFGVRPRGGDQACPSNPETPFVLELSAPLGDRLLLDGSSVPPRDATTCPDVAMCP